MNAWVLSTCRSIVISQTFPRLWGVMECTALIKRGQPFVGKTWGIPCSRLMALLLSAVLLSFMLSEIHPCSLPQGVPLYTPTERTVLAPIVFKALVLNRTSHRSYDEYKACVRVKRVFKADVRVPEELCFGRFGPEELCLEHVSNGNSYIFFVDTDLTARYDGFPIATLSATVSNTAAVERGYCKIGVGDCQPPRINELSFKHRVFVGEGKNAAVICTAAGTAPLVVTWTRNGHPAAQRGTSLLLEDAAFDDRGTYTCTVRNPAGKVEENTVVFIGDDRFDTVKLFCDSDLVLKVKPRELTLPLSDEFSAHVLVNYKPGLPAVGDNVTIYNCHSGPEKLYGCLQNVERGKEYYVFANREGPRHERVLRNDPYRAERFQRGSVPRERFVSTFIVMLGSRKTPPNLEEKMDSYKNKSPQCP